jgi:hypothetical protein
MTKTHVIIGVVLASLLVLIGSYAKDLPEKFKQIDYEECSSTTTSTTSE